MKIETVKLMLVVLLVLCGFELFVAAEQCGDVLERPLTLDEAGVSSFPTRNFQRKLKRSRKGVKEWLKNAEESVEANLREEDNNQGTWPSCYYANTCPSSVKIAQYWQVPGLQCWNVEPIPWVMCDTDTPESNCKPPDDDNVELVGLSCRERYSNTQVWVYCDDKSGIQLMTIGVPTACIAVKNRC